jgi:hypothetical protein
MASERCRVTDAIERVALSEASATLSRSLLTMTRSKWWIILLIVVAAILAWVVYRYFMGQARLPNFHW